MENTNEESQSSDEFDYPETSITIQELEENFNARAFAKSLLPHPESDECVEYDDTTYYGEFLDNLEEKLHAEATALSNAKAAIATDNFEYLRTFSRVVFKKRQFIESMGKPSDPQLIEAAEETSQTKVGKHQCDDDEQYFPPLEDVVKIEGGMKTFQEERKLEKLQSECKITQDINHLTLIESSERKFFRFFNLDAHENHFGDCSVVYLFGKFFCNKDNIYKSCCVAVGPLKRRLFVLPCTDFGQISEENVSAKQIEMFKEFYCLVLKPMKISKFNCRFVLRKNFDDLFGQDSQMFMEIEYSAKYPPVDKQITGITFSKIYGSKENCLQSFLLEKNMKGPCWLDVLNPKIREKPITWCFIELMCKPEDISLTKSNFEAPPLTILSMDVKYYDTNSKQKGEIAAISWAVNSNYNIVKSMADSDIIRSYCAFVTPMKGVLLPEALKMSNNTMVKNLNSEYDLLIYFLNEFHKIDPDILLGYDFQTHAFQNFINRLVSFKMDGSKLGRFKDVREHSDVKKLFMFGRLICDMKILVKDLISSKAQELSELYKNYLNMPNEEHSGSLIYDTFSLGENLSKLVVSAINEAINLLKLAFSIHIIPLCIKLSNICGNILSEIFKGGASKRSEYLLLHAFHEKGYVLPDRTFRKKSKRENEDILSGGLVLEPAIGFYDHFILLMDFQSLYPSIIHEYNLCISHPYHNTTNFVNLPQGVLPSIMQSLMKRRTAVKNMMEKLDVSSSSYFRLKTYQTALKLSANAMYGCLASQFFRFHCPVIAKEITSRGRDILNNSVHILRNKGFEVIYGDTDSIMVNTKTKDLTAVQHLGEQIKEIINNQFSSVHLNIDTIFKSLLILKKKKYAGIKVTINETNGMKFETVLKGMDILKNERPLFVCEIGSKVVDYILSDLSLDGKIVKIKELVDQVKEDLLNNRIPIQSYVITKFLSQELIEYTMANSHPHIQVAIRCNENLICNYRKGDAVSYVVCCDGTNNSCSKRAYHLDEMKDHTEWNIDVSYYLKKQLYPVISTICKPFERIYAAIGSHLGVKEIESKDVENVDVKRNEFENRDPFIFNCLSCGKKNVVHSEYDQQTSNQHSVLFRCQNSFCSSCPLKNHTYLRNKIVLAIRTYINKYYEYETKCSIKKCSFVSCRVPLDSAERNRRCSSCGKGRMQQTYSEIDLFLQLEYFRSLFESRRHISSEQWIEEAYQCLLQPLYSFNQLSNFDTVNLNELFANF